MIVCSSEKGSNNVGKRAASKYQVTFLRSIKCLCTEICVFCYIKVPFYSNFLRLLFVLIDIWYMVFVIKLNECLNHSAKIFDF